MIKLIKRGNDYSFGLGVRVFANGPGHTKDSKMVLDASLLSTQHYKVRIKGKVEQSRKGVAPSPTHWCSSYRKGSLRVTLDYGRQLFFILLEKKMKGDLVASSYYRKYFFSISHTGNLLSRQITITKSIYQLDVFVFSLIVFYFLNKLPNQIKNWQSVENFVIKLEDFRNNKNKKLRSHFGWVTLTHPKWRTIGRITPENLICM